MNYEITVNSSGDKAYYVNNKLHREDGPAVIYSSGNKFWYKNGKLHREEGPAVELSNGQKGWYLNNIFYGSNDDFTSESWKRFIKTIIFS